MERNSIILGVFATRKLAVAAMNGSKKRAKYLWIEDYDLDEGRRPDSERSERE